MVSAAKTTVSQCKSSGVLLQVHRIPSYPSSVETHSTQCLDRNHGSWRRLRTKQSQERRKIMVARIRCAERVDEEDGHGRMVPMSR